VARHRAPGAPAPRLLRVAVLTLSPGFNPYAGITGLTCESMASATIVQADGSIVTASRSQNQELFWASCGGAGGSFGVATSFVFDTHPAADFNNNVHFRYRWPITRAGEVLDKFVDYTNEDGNVWVRIEFNLDDGVVAYGACWASPNVADCERRLGQAAFFGVAERSTLLTRSSSRVQDFQLFIGPAGNWGRQLPNVTEEKAFVGTNYDQAGLGFKRMYTSSFWRFAAGKPGAAVFQQVADILWSTDRSKAAFMLAQWNPWEGAQVRSESEYAFAHRNADAFTEFIGGKDDAVGGQVEEVQTEMARVHTAILAVMDAWKYGVYGNYPEFGLADDAYSTCPSRSRAAPGLLASALLCADSFCPSLLLCGRLLVLGQLASASCGAAAAGRPDRSVRPEAADAVGHTPVPRLAVDHWLRPHSQRAHPGLPVRAAERDADRGSGVRRLHPGRGKRRNADQQGRTAVRGRCQRRCGVQRHHVCGDVLNFDRVDQQHHLRTFRNVAVEHDGRGGPGDGLDELVQADEHNWMHKDAARRKVRQLAGQRGGAVERRLLRWFMR
jgi:hypothetical protein